MADRAIRATQLADQIRDYLAVWIRTDFPGELLTVSTVTLKPNLRDATVWVSCFNEGHIPSVTQSLKKREREYHQKLYSTLRRRGLPTLHIVVTGIADAQEPFSPQLLK